MESRRGMKNEPSLAGSPAQFLAAQHRRAFEFGLVDAEVEPSASAWKPIITEAGKRQGCEER